MKVLLDACVLYPTVMRRILLGVAKQGHYEPLWSDRILEEWARAVARDGEVAEASVRSEIAVLKATWHCASIQPRAGDLARLVLPDPDDVHVLAAAIAGSADGILTVNAKDFPRRTLAEEGLARLDPDPFLLRLWEEAPDAVGGVVAGVHRDAREDGIDLDLRALLKRARLPRLGKALS